MKQFFSPRTFEYAAEAVLVADADGTVQLLNRAAEALFDCDWRSAVGSRCWMVARLHLPDASPFCGPHCPLLRDVEGGAPHSWRRLVQYPRKGPPHSIDLVSILIPPPNGGPCSIFHLVDTAVEAPLRLSVRAGGSRCRAGPARRENDYLLGIVAPAIADKKKAARLPANGGRLGPLSQREAEVLALLASGNSTKQVTEALFISTVTVRNHVQAILRKLGVHSRLDAVLLWLHRPF